MQIKRSEVSLLMKARSIMLNLMTPTGKKNNYLVTSDLFHLFT